MSTHKSLVSSSKLKRHRNVLTRTERLEKLAEEGKWDESQSVFGLPKVKHMMTVRVTKQKKTDEEAEAAAEGVEAAEGAEGAQGEGAEPSEGKE
jgi:small basic protein (TIGR04137 family)